MNAEIKYIFKQNFIICTYLYFPGIINTHFKGSAIPKIQNENTYFFYRLFDSGNHFSSIFYYPPRAHPTSKVNLVSSNGTYQILSTIDNTILPNGPIGPTEGNLTAPAFIEMLNQKGNDLRNYIASEYEEDFGNFSNQEMILVGLILMPFEERDNNNLMDPGQAFSCLMTAIGVATGVGALVTEFTTAWSSGLSAKSLLRIIGRMAGTYLSWFMVGWAVKEFGECVGWW